MSVRQPAVAGRFYSADKQSLQTEVKRCLAGNIDAEENIKAVIVPHAGYCYSGKVAGAAYRLLAQQANNYNRAIILGPNHRVALQGLAVSHHNAFATPLGDVDIDTKLRNQLLEKGLVNLGDEAHRLEHSLEVQLPFLQMCLPDIKVLPIVVGSMATEAIVQLLQEVDKPDTLLVISTDLSHFHVYEQARLIDKATIKRMHNLATNLSGEEACGSNVLNGFFTYCTQQCWQMHFIDYKNSGDTGGDKTSVVGYVSFVVSA